MTMQTLATANQKGGVGKSAFDTQFAYYCAIILKLRVLFIDNDHQGNASKALSKSNRVVVSKTTAYDLFKSKVTTIEEGDFVVIPADPQLMDLERNPQEHNAYAGNYMAFIESMQDRFDVCIIDTNPNPDIRMTVSFLVANHVISPIELNQEAIDGIYLLLKHKRVGIEKMQATLNKNLNFIGILPNKVESTPFHKTNFTQLALSGYGKYLIRPDSDANAFAYIQLRSVIAEAQADGCPLWEVKVKNKDGAAEPGAGIKTSARETWREIKPFFNLIAQRMNLEV